MLNKKKVLKWISVITIGLITNIICIPLQHNIVPALAQTDQIADVQYSENFEESIGEWKTRGGAVVSQD